MICFSDPQRFRTLVTAIVAASAIVLLASNAQAQAQACQPILTAGTNFYNQYKNGTFPSHFDMEGWATATNTTLVLRNWTFGKSYRVFWYRWGNVDISTTTTISCNAACNIITSTTGTSNRTDSIITAAIARSEKATGRLLSIVAAASSALSSSGGPTVTVGTAPLTVGFTWPPSSDQNTMQMGTFRWQCQPAPAPQPPAAGVQPPAGGVGTSKPGEGARQ